MEIIEQGTEDVYEMAGVNCCWPPGTLAMWSPEPE